MKFFITNFSMGLGNHHHLLKSHTIFKTYLLPLYLKKNSSCFQFFIFKHFPITFLDLIYRTNICCCLGWIYIAFWGGGCLWQSWPLYNFTNSLKNFLIKWTSTKCFQVILHQPVHSCTFTHCSRWWSDMLCEKILEVTFIQNDIVAA